ncbi:hypothetical protein GCM10027418_15990 [Mariniluteicoccus endophyticus]
MDSTGVVIPTSDDGKRSTTALGRAVFADAFGDLDPVGARAALGETDWRSGYAAHARRLVEAGLASDDAALGIARRGLESLHRRMRVVGRSGEIPLDDVFATESEKPLTTRTVVGTGTPVHDFSLPLHGRRLQGAELHTQLERWTTDGIIEPSAADAVREVVDHPEWLSLPGRRVAVLGAGAEMGPLRALLDWGAEVVAIDLPRPEIWRRVEALAAQGAGTLHVPRHGDETGADLLHDLSAVADWLESFDGPLVLGNYVYADGAVNLRVSMATDALATHLSSVRDGLALAYLATPTDVFGVPQDVIDHSVRSYESRTLRRLRPVLKGVSGGKLLKRNYRPGAEPGVVDSMIVQQGPNYILAKRLQRWRASVALRDGLPVSMNVAPPTKTRSVTKNRALAAAYAGAHRFGVEVFEPATSNTLMAALLVHDLMSGRTAEPREPWREEAAKAVHGGLWRGPYDPRSALGIALVLGWGSSRA